MDIYTKKREKKLAESLYAYIYDRVYSRSDLKPLDEMACIEIDKLIEVVAEKRKEEIHNFVGKVILNELEINPLLEKELSEEDKVISNYLDKFINDLNKF